MEDNGEGKGAEWAENILESILTQRSHVWKCIETVQSGKAVLLLRYSYIHICYAYVTHTLTYVMHTLFVRSRTIFIRYSYACLRYAYGGKRYTN